jgi:hypothetical protein
VPPDPAKNERSWEAVVCWRFEAHLCDTLLCAVSTSSANCDLLSQQLG